ncbi:MAG: hypothetical protein J5I98_28845, partial [Phaeodactylibacter sp.]|nr:hypothetical protein [Phaeodactylibacter sp.]
QAAHYQHPPSNLLKGKSTQNAQNLLQHSKTVLFSYFILIQQANQPTVPASATPPGQPYNHITMKP